MILLFHHEHSVQHHSIELYHQRMTLNPFVCQLKTYTPKVRKRSEIYTLKSFKSKKSQSDQREHAHIIQFLFKIHNKKGTSKSKWRDYYIRLCGGLASQQLYILVWCILITNARTRREQKKKLKLY